MSHILLTLSPVCIGAKVTRSILSTFDKVDGVEFDFIASVRWVVQLLTSFSLPFNELSLMGLALDLVD